MTKNDLIRSISERKTISKKEATKYVNAVLGAIGDALAKGEQVVIPDFGRFKVKTMPEHMGTHPSTGRKITIPSKKRVTFKPFTRILSFSIIN